MVAMGRGLLADPDCITKARQGREKEIRPCVRCNICIERTHGHRLPVRCAVNPLVGREAEFVNFLPPRSCHKVVIIGGGPAGMEAARTAAGRGHTVVLFEKRPVLGGTLTAAAAAPFKSDLQNYLDWAIRSTLETPGLTVRLATEAVPETVKAEQPDTLIIAAGAAPLIPRIPGIHGRNVIWAGDLESRMAEVGEKVVVAGAGLTGCEAALLLAQQGKKVTVIDRLSAAEIDAGYPQISMLALRSLLQQFKAEMINGVELEKITRTGVTVREIKMDKDRKKVVIHCDTVVLALGMTPDAEAIEEFRDTAPDVIAIGDCANQPGSLYTAVTEGFTAGVNA